MLSGAQLSRLCESWRSRSWSQWSQDCWDCAWRYTQCSVAFLYLEMFVNFRCKMYCIYTETKYFSELNRIDGKPMEFEWKIFPSHDSGHPQWDSENDGRITVWSSGLQRQDHLHVNVQRHCMGCTKKWRINWNSTKELKNTLKDFLTIIGISLDLVQKKRWYATCNSKPNGCFDRTVQK